MLFNRKLNLKKILSISAVALTLATTGTIITPNINTSITTQTVKAAIIDPENVYKDNGAYMIKPSLFEKQLVKNGESHYRNWHSYGKNSIHFYWYKRPKMRMVYNNVDVIGNNIDYTANQNTYDATWAIVGKVRINGRNLYMIANGTKEVILEDTANVDKKPKLYKAHNIMLYQTSGGPNAEKYGYGTISIFVPYYHKPVTLPNIDTGKLGQYIPVMAPSHDQDESFLMSVKDFSKMIHQCQPRTVYMYDHGSTLSYHHGHFSNTGNTKWRLHKIYNNGYALTKSRHHKVNQRKAQKNLIRMLNKHILVDDIMYKQF